MLVRKCARMGLDRVENYRGWELSVYPKKTLVQTLVYLRSLRVFLNSKRYKKIIKINEVL